MKFTLLALTAFLLAGASAENTGTTTKDTTTKDSSILSPDSSANDLKKIDDCSKISAKDLNGLKDPKTCSALTASCLAKVSGIPDINGACLGEMPSDQWKKLDKETLTEMTKAKIDNLVFLTPERLERILKKTDLAKLPDSFTGFVVIDGKLLDTVFKLEDARIFKAFFTAKNLQRMDPAAFSYFSSQLIGVLNEDAFSEIEGRQLSGIPADSFSGFTPKQWSKVTPTALLTLTDAEASHLSNDCYNSMTQEQIRNFGKAVTTAPTFTGASADETKKADVHLARIKFASKHPCQAFYRRSGDINKDQAAAFEAVCKPVKEFKASSGAPALLPTLSAVGLVLAGALVPALL